MVRILIAKFIKWISLQSFVTEIRGKYRKLHVKRKLTIAQKREIQNYFQKLIGKRVPLIWHKFLYSRTGVYAKNYIPVGVYRTDFIGRMNNFPFMDAYADKNVSDLLFPDVIQPRNILKNINGYYYIGHRAVSREEAIAHCQNIENAIIKPSLSTRGQGVRKISVQNGVSNIDHKSINQVFDLYKNENFLIQDIVLQHQEMRALNADSLNTIRLLTYRSGMEVILLYGVIRIGKAGQVTDNESAGGISTRINPDGTLAKYAFGSPGNDMVEKTDSGITLEGYAIPSYHAVVEKVKELHLRLPYFNIAAWDFAVGENGEPVFIEWNANPDLSQSAYGPAFGENTERVISEIIHKPNTRHQYW